MDVLTLPSCSNHYGFNERKINYSAVICFCCLAENVSLVNIRKCNHNHFIKQYLTMETPDLYICTLCHMMLKKIEAFRNQVYTNYCSLISGLSNDVKEDYRFIIKPLSRTEVTVMSYDLEAKPIEIEALKEEFQGPETEVPSIKNELDDLSNDFDCEIPSHCEPETIDNPTPTIDNIESDQEQCTKRNLRSNLKRKQTKKVTKKHRHKKLPKDKRKLKQSIDKITNNVEHINEQENVLKEKVRKNCFKNNLEHNNDQENPIEERVRRKHNGKSEENIGNLEKKYIGKVEILNLSMEELMEEREEKKNKEPYSKMEYKCEYCIKGFVHDFTYEAHMTKRHTTQPGLFSCEICKSVFTKESSYSYHYKRHFKRYVCLVCNKMNHDLASIAEHYNVTHPEREPIQMSLVCTKCDFNTNSSRKYRYHMDLHRGGITCEKCNKIFCTLQTYKTHIKLWHKKSPPKFKCDLCSKTYKCRSGLFAHKKYGPCFSVPVKTAYCVTCDMHFKTERNYENHLKTSGAHVTEDAFKFICDLCDKKFKLKVYLETHMIREHLKTKNFKCSYCGKMWFSKRILKNHINHVHLKIRPPRDKVCDFCGKAFFTTQILRNHIRIHTGERPLNCPFCEATFGHKAALYTHKKLVHKVPKKNIDP